METIQESQAGLHNSVRVKGVLKLLRNISIFVVFCYIVGFTSLAGAGFLYFVYLTWRYIPEIATGKDFAQTSSRARGVTILLGLVFAMLLVIVFFVALLK